MPKSKPNRNRPKPRRKTPKRRRPERVVPPDPMSGIETWSNCPDGMWIDYDTGLPSAIGNEDWGPDLLSRFPSISGNSVC